MLSPRWWPRWSRPSRRSRRLKRFTRALTLSTVVVVLPVTLSWLPSSAVDAGPLPTGDPALMNLIAAEQALLDLTNADRAANDEAPLQFDPDMLAIARERAEQQLGAPSLSHYDADGQLIFVRLLDQAQLPYQLAGENLARGSLDDASVVERIEQALMQSPTHRRNILEPTFTRVAIGAATDTTSDQITFAEIYRT